MRILIWGLGYVGTVTAGCLARLGHDVIGIDSNDSKVEAVNRGCSPVKEPGLDDLVREAVASGKLKAAAEGEPYINGADLSLIAVGTPSSHDGRPVLDYIAQVAEQIGRGLRKGGGYHVIVLRSTVFPGVLRQFLGPIVEKFSGLKAGPDFGLASNPEFLRESSAIRDFLNAPYTVIGELDERSGMQVARMYEGLEAVRHHVRIEEAELLKFVNNAFHALKIGFANEVGRLCQELAIDSHQIMSLVCADRQLNISPAYLKPGFAFGGSCLPKDLRALTFKARCLGVRVPILESILPSNACQIEAARLRIQFSGASAVAVLGLSFKPGTDDLRESPVIDLIRALWQDGINVLVHDPDVNPEEMLGSNRAYLERQLPQIHQILRADVEQMIAESEAVVVCQKREEFTRAIQGLNGKTAVLDLVRIVDDPETLETSNYNGFSW